MPDFPQNISCQGLKAHVVTFFFPLKKIYCYLFINTYNFLFINIFSTQFRKCKYLILSFVSPKGPRILPFVKKGLCSFVPLLFDVALFGGWGGLGSGWCVFEIG